MSDTGLLYTPLDLEVYRQRLLVRYNKIPARADGWWNANVAGKGPARYVIKPTVSLSNTYFVPTREFEHAAKSVYRMHNRRTWP